jgi:hypothetical protein
MIDIHWNKWSLIDMDDMLMIKHYLEELGKNFIFLFFTLFNLLISRRFYARQDEMIDQLSTMHERHTSGTAHDERAQRHKRWAYILIKTTLISNIVR